MRDLPSLPALLAFAGAARLGSFTAAAKDMGTTQPLISHHVRVLETEFGKPLFQRRARGVTLTEAGRQLADAVEAGFAEIARVSRALKSDRSRAQVTVATDFGLATYWLLPRLANFRSSNPDIEVRILTTQGPVSPELDADFAIALVAEEKMAPAVHTLFPERVRPVASPSFLEKHGPFATLQDLTKAPLLHLEGHEDDWFTWKSWFQATGIAKPAFKRELSFNSYPLLLQAAIAGEGIALGWRGLIDDLLAAGSLRSALDITLKSGRHYALIPLNARLSVAGASLMDWLSNA